MLSLCVYFVIIGVFKIWRNNNLKVYCTVNFKKDIENLIGLLIFRFNLNLITLAINYEIPKLRRKNKITFHGSLAENDCQLTLLKKVLI